MEEQVVTPVVDTSAPNVPNEAPTASAPPQQSTLPPDVALSTAETTAVPAYEPNTTFRVHEEEKQFEDWTKPLLTNKEVEAKFRELYEKAGGLDFVKPKFERAREELRQVSEKKNYYDNVVTSLSTHVKNRDFDAFFRDTGIPERMVYEWVAHKLKYQDLSPEDKRAYDERIELRRQNAAYERDLGSKSNEVNQLQTKSLEFELNTELSRPDTNSVMQEYDQRMGRVGAFREQVAIQAHATEIATGQRVTAGQAVTNLLTIMGRTPGSQSAVHQSPGQGGVIQPQSKPVIPNIKARGGNPVQKVPKSIDELRANAQRRIAELEG